MRVAVVNETFVRRYYPGQDALGKRIDQGQGWATIVGVVKDGKYRDLNEAPTSVVYSSLKQWHAPVITLHVRTTNNPKLLTETVRRELTAINAQLPFLDPRTMSEHIDVDVTGLLRKELSPDQAGDKLLECMFRTANGRLTAAEALGHREFVLTRLYESA